MKIKSNVKTHGHWFKILEKDFNIPAMMIVTVTKQEFNELELRDTFNKAIEIGHLEIMGKKKAAKKKETDTSEGLEKVGLDD